MWFRVFVGVVITLKIAVYWYFVKHGQFVDNDSALYIRLAENLLNQQAFSESSVAPFDAHVFRTPGYPAFLALLSFLGMEGNYWAVFWQEIIYGFCVFLFYHYGKLLFDRNIVIAGVIFLLLEPGSWVYPKLIMTEVLFLPFFFAGIFLIGTYLRRVKWSYLAMAGVLLGLGALIKPAVLFLPLVIAVILAGFDLKNQNRWLHAGVFVLAFVITLSPWLIRNYQHYHKVFMSSAQGNILAKYHVPIIWDVAGVIPREQGNILAINKINQLVEQRSNKLGRPLTAVEIDELEQKFAVSELRKYPLLYFRQWIFGSIKTMVGPFITQLYDSFGIRSERPHFYEVIRQSNSFADGVVNYFIHLDFVFLLNALATIMMAGFALLGVFFIINQKDCFLWILMLTNFYFIFLPGPEGYPRFRFPVSLFWFIQAYYGFRWLREKLRRNQIIVTPVD